MAYPGATYKIADGNRSSYNVISHDRYGIPDSPLYGHSPRRPANPPAHQEEDIEAIRDREIKLMRGLVKPNYQMRADNRSSYDLISGIPVKTSVTDPDFRKIREREMNMAAHGGRPNVPNDSNNPSPAPPPARVDHPQIPPSPLYRPGQDLGQGQPGRGYTPRDDQWYGGAPEMQPAHKAPDEPMSHRQNDGYDPRDNVPSDPSPQPRAPEPHVSIGRLDELPRSPLYKPGQPGPPVQQGPPAQNPGLITADPRTGSAIRERRPWQAGNTARPTFPPTPDYNTTKLNIGQNDDDDTKLRLNLFGGRDDVRVLDEFRDHRGNTVIKGYPPNSYRAGYGLSSDKGLPKHLQANARRDPQGDAIGDPRTGGPVATGPGLSGSRNGGALFFIKFPTSKGNVQVAGHAFLRAKTHDCGGRYLGMARRVYDFGYEKGPDEAIAVFHFPTMDKALLFFQTDNILRQPDFPPPYGHAEMWIVSNAYLPDNMQLFDTFLLSEVQLHNGKDRREFFENFQVPFENYLYKNGAMPFVVCSYGPRDRRDIRRHCYPHTAIVTCHLFQGIDHLNWMCNEETYSKFRTLHNQVATEKCTIFKLSRDTGL